MKDLLQRQKARAIGGLYAFVKIAVFRLINLLILNSTSYPIQARRFVAQVSTREETALEELGV